MEDAEKLMQDMLDKVAWRRKAPWELEEAAEELLSKANETKTIEDTLKAMRAIMDCVKRASNDANGPPAGLR